MTNDSKFGKKSVKSFFIRSISFSDVFKKVFIFIPKRMNKISTEMDVIQLYIYIYISNKQ